MPKLRPIVKYFGGKHYISPWIIEHFPKNYQNMQYYVEPYSGMASTLLLKEPNPNEIINDLDKGVVYLWKAVKSHTTVFIDILSRLSYNEATFVKYRDNNCSRATLVHCAVREYVVRRMSRGGLGKSFAWSDRLRGGKPGDQNAWETSIKQLPTIAKRISGVHISQRPAIDVIKDFDSQSTLQYIDPPYLHETRNKTALQAYACEMTFADHENLLDTLLQCKSSVVLSGRPSSLYNDKLKNWNYYHREVVNHSGQTSDKKRQEEGLWTNF